MVFKRVVRKVKLSASSVMGIKAFVQFPIFIKKDDGWFIVICPFFKLAAQGKTEKEAKENMENLIQLYLKDPDTPKPAPHALIEDLMSTTLSSIPMEIRGDMINVPAETAIKA